MSADQNESTVRQNNESPEIVVISGLLRMVRGTAQIAAFLEETEGYLPADVQPPSDDLLGQGLFAHFEVLQKFSFHGDSFHGIGVLGGRQLLPFRLFRPTDRPNGYEKSAAHMRHASVIELCWLSTYSMDSIWLRGIIVLHPTSMQGSSSPNSYLDTSAP